MQVSSPGAFGFRPWLNLQRGVYGVFMMRREPGAPTSSSLFDPWKLIDLVHAAVATGDRLAGAEEGRERAE